MSKEISVVTTTITIPENYPDIYENAKKFDHDIHLYVVGDNKTPNNQIRKYLKEHIPEEDWTLLTMRNQKGWLNKNFGRSKASVYRDVFQENNYQRRIIGFLIAAQEGAKKIIAVDDDNFPVPDEDYIQMHDTIVGTHDEMLTVLPGNTYVNTLDFLNKDKSYDPKPYVRGYPIHLRGDSGYVFNKEPVDVAVNIGLWSKAPDVDALTRLASGDIQIEHNPHMMPIAVANGCHTSMCLQNICFDTEYLVTQYEFPMNVNINGMKMGRYDDIWAGYVCKKVLDHNHKHMAFGPPMAIHKRYTHDYTQDFVNEFWGMWANMFFYSAIQAISLGSFRDPWSNFVEVIAKMRHAVQFADSGLKSYFNRVWKEAYYWAQMIDQLGLK